jgi:hypothetical protein
VRVFAASADKPYAKPGDVVTVSLDAFDGRPTTTGDVMTIYWLPILCEDPPGDLYYACFASLVTPTKGGGSMGGGAFPPNIDITDFLEKGPKKTLTMPGDVITKHAPVMGLPEPYGMVIVFAMACAGRVRTLPIDPSAGNGQTVPLGCFDSMGIQLGPDSYVFTFARVYAYETATNTNPQIDGVVFDGKPIDLNAGVVVDHCTGGNKSPSCAGHPLNVTIPDSSWEVATGTPLEPDGTQLHEEIWTDYYYTIDNTKSDGILLFDARKGRVSGSDNQYLANVQPGQGRIFIVVHDNRGGASWVDFPILVR